MRNSKPIIISIAAILFISLVSGCTSSTGKRNGIKRLDKEGYLYYMDFTKDYYSQDVMNKMMEIGYVAPGCSVFYTHNFEGDGIVGRNYDFAHRVSEDDSTITGLNIILHCKPEGKYESIAVADAVWCGENNPLLQKGGPNKEGFDSSLLDILPYQCMDGINEKGLYVSVQRVDIKKGEQKDRFPAGSSMLLRHILDDCANIDEAINKISTGVLLPVDWQDCHFMVCDSTGRSVVIESRNSIVSVIDSDICTNFYLASDDIEDSYRNGILREDAIKTIDENGTSKYHYGFGHGYHRFVTIQGQLESYRDTKREEYYTVMPESNALLILQSVAQNPYTNAVGVSMTQYSVIYNIDKKTLKVWPFQNYSKSYSYDVEGKRSSL